MEKGEIPILKSSVLATALGSIPNPKTIFYVTGSRHEP